MQRFATVQTVAVEIEVVKGHPKFESWRFQMRMMDDN